MDENRFNCDSFRTLLQSHPLYKKERINGEFAEIPLGLENFGFPFLCICQAEQQTHLLKFEEETLRKMEIHAANNNRLLVSKRVRYAFYEINGLKGQKFTEKVYGECQNCKRKRAVFLIEFFTELHEENYYFYAKKIGQDPPFSINVDGFAKKILNPENLDLYKKALMNLSSNFGIGAFAYFRRIVENEILHLLTEVAEINTPESMELKKLLERHESEHALSQLIDEIFKYLPDSLKGLGHNPFRLLYGTLSVGIHQLSEDECFEKATSLKFVLEFVLKKIYEEKTEVSKVRDHIKNLS
ncbi:hypothetical protein [Algoriphagus sp. Y33]|uniref:hypothetical protein n=1 Tax=Algoriphagus sp. Y33 TaxID=2772483 RepID=UPI00177AC100|nr:hypothetical protein [Algoriphagus sp. Y33]